jgi:tetratricopeptide (TPR) repeat protein
MGRRIAQQLDYSDRVTSSGASFVSRRQLLERCAHVREDHLRYLEKWGVIRAHGRGRDAGYAFADVAVVRQAEAELAQGATFRAVLRTLVAARAGQLTFDFRVDAPAAKVIELKRRPAPPMAALLNQPVVEQASHAEQTFLTAAAIDDGDPRHFDDALAAYRRALEEDPYLVPALINLANILYARDQIAEAQALYERAISIDPDVFEAHFNLGNIFHDLGRFALAHECYRRALRLNPTYADAHFYLAVTLEKSGMSQEARPHWRAYQQLAPQGEWVELAREFSE